MARRIPQGQQTRERILAVALREFAERGYSAVSVEEISETAGVSKGAFYYWFPDKDELGRELQHDLYERLTTASMRVLQPGEDILSGMLRSFHSYLAALGDLGEARFFLRDAWVIPALEESGRRDHEDAIAMVRGILVIARERGEIVDLDPDALARVLMGAWAEATLHVLRTGERTTTVAVVEHLIRSLRPLDRSSALRKPKQKVNAK